MIVTDKGIEKTGTAGQLKGFFTQVGIDTTLSDLNVKEDQFQELEDYALEDPCCPLNPKKVEKGDVVNILRNAL